MEEPAEQETAALVAAQAEEEAAHREVCRLIGTQRLSSIARTSCSRLVKAVSMICFSTSVDAPGAVATFSLRKMRLFL